MGKYTRELDPAPSIDGASLVAVSEETTDDLYKTTVANFGKNQETIVTTNTGNNSSVGTMTTGATTTELVLSDLNDYDAVTIGTVITVEGDSQHIELKVAPNKLIVHPDTEETRTNASFVYSYPFSGNVLSDGNATGYINKDLARFKTNVEMPNNVTTGDINAGDINAGDITATTVVAETITATTSLNSPGNFSTTDITCSNITVNTKATLKKVLQKGTGTEIAFKDKDDAKTNLTIDETGVVTSPRSPAWFAYFSLPVNPGIGQTLKFDRVGINRGSYYNLVYNQLYELPVGLYSVFLQVTLETRTWSPDDLLELTIDTFSQDPGRIVRHDHNFEDTITDEVTISCSGLLNVPAFPGSLRASILCDSGTVIRSDSKETYFCGFKIV